MCCGRTSAYSIPIGNTDPGPDGVLGTGDDGGALTYYDYTAAYAGSAFVQNKDLNTDGYEQQLPQRRGGRAEAAVEQMAARHLVPGHPHGHVAQWHSAGSRTPPASSPKSKYWEWGFKLSGSYELPWQIQAAAMFTSQSGAVWARDARFTTGLVRLSEVILLMEDAAANRLPTQNILNLRVEKKVKIGPGYGLLPAGSVQRDQHERRAGRDGAVRRELQQDHEHRAAVRREAGGRLYLLA